MNSYGNVGGEVGGSYDTNVSHYSISELIDLVGLRGVEHIGDDEFSDIIAGFVDKYRTVDETLSRFFENVGHRLYTWLNSGGVAAATAAATGMTGRLRAMTISARGWR